MKRIETRSTLRYTVRTPTTFLFQIAVAANEHQRIVEESLETEPALELEAFEIGGEGNRMHRAIVEPGPLEVRYRAIVELDQDVAEPARLAQATQAELPAEALPYLNPSRYCESDRLMKFAWDRFGDIDPGHGRVAAVVDWVHDHLDYVPGSTGATTTACDVLVQGAGVCRDYAHLTISLCRALGLPARYVAGYAVDLEPPDFHGFCEVWLGDAWYLFDATRLAPVSGFVRIGTGRDAADASFATIVGSAGSEPPTVSAARVDDGDDDGDGAPDADANRPADAGSAVSIG